MNVMIFDTETTSINKPFCYNIGYTIFDTETEEISLKEDFVIEQVWHNPMLFTTAYYADKRPIYVNRMKGRTVKLEKFGYVTQRMARLIKEFDIAYAYAYNSRFDEKVFDFNCDWFKVINPFDNVEVLDIRGLVHNKIAFTDDFKAFCEEHEQFTEKGNYSTTAETLFRYITKDKDFEEEHTALADAIIETEILKHCIHLGLEYGIAYKTYVSIPREQEKTLTIFDKRLQTEVFESEIRKFRQKEKDGEITITIE